MDDAAQRQTHLEAAATEITNIANEGDKRIQAVRQCLKKAGHTHNTDDVTKEDFMFIDSKKKKQLLDLGQKVARPGASASADDIRAVHNELTQIVEKAIAGGRGWSILRSPRSVGLLGCRTEAYHVQVVSL